MNNTDLLLHNFLVELPQISAAKLDLGASRTMGTICNNMLYYGFVPSQELYKQITALPLGELEKWWDDFEAAMKRNKGDDKNIGKYIVYQNFPAEVLKMSEAEYWFKQVLMYWGVPPELMQGEKVPRAKLFEKTDFRVLHIARPSALENLFAAKLSKPAAWTADDKEEIGFFLNNGFQVEAPIAFKENLIFAAILCMKKGIDLPISTTTDVLRLATGLSGGDISLNTNSKFKLKRAQRRFILLKLSEVGDLQEGLMRHKNKWIRLFHQLHIGEYAKQYPAIYEAATILREGGFLPTFNSDVEHLIEAKNKKVFSLLAQRPGVFARRIVHLIQIFGDFAVEKFLPCLEKLPTLKLMQLKRFLETINYRNHRTFPPKSNWGKVQVVENKILLSEKNIQDITTKIDAIAKARITEKIGNDIHYSSDLDGIKLPSNNADAATRFNKGTVLKLPKNTKFIRTATFWVLKENTCWMDNSWNFFDDDWKPRGTCCWNVTGEMKPAAVFSGDPVNSYNKEGKAGQLIDLYLDKLKKKKVRFAVWNVLSYSRLKFDECEEVLGLMMLGEDPIRGKLIEPSRVSFAIPITGSGMTKYICCLDLLKRTITILDAGLKGNIGSAKMNEKTLEEAMPAYMEHLDSLPSMHDLFSPFESSENPEAFHAVYSDEKACLIKGEKAYVFQPKNDKNDFTPMMIEDFLT